MRSSPRVYTLTLDLFRINLISCSSSSLAIYTPSILSEDSVFHLYKEKCCGRSFLNVASEAFGFVCRSYSEVYRTEWNNKHKLSIRIGERERANLVVRSRGIFCHIAFVRGVSAHARLCTRLFYFQIFTHFHTRCFSICVDRSQRENSPPLDGMRCNLR